MLLALAKAVGCSTAQISIEDPHTGGRGFEMSAPLDSYSGFEALVEEYEGLIKLNSDPQDYMVEPFAEAAPWSTAAKDIENRINSALPHGEIFDGDAYPTSSLWFNTTEEDLDHMFVTVMVARLPEN